MLHGMFNVTLFKDREQKIGCMYLCVFVYLCIFIIKNIFKKDRKKPAHEEPFQNSKCLPIQTYRIVVKLDQNRPMRLMGESRILNEISCSQFTESANTPHAGRQLDQPILPSYITYSILQVTKNRDCFKY